MRGMLRGRRVGAEERAGLHKGRSCVSEGVLRRGKVLAWCHSSGAVHSSVRLERSVGPAAAY